ncbi:hypothetical protein J2S43_007418 [Catenuloplanes nepalensis]|uniref:Uncharacterized protein n=1 Tax=Catenuloplanes nepalensis TaxID=587533 RepID=A0ABT9N6N4_9ACTN|nr:hypothetical protein [Catenuloplanes nepalensis]
MHRDLLDAITYEARHRAKHLAYEQLRQEAD